MTVRTAEGAVRSYHYPAWFPYSYYVIQPHNSMQFQFPVGRLEDSRTFVYDVKVRLEGKIGLPNAPGAPISADYSFKTQKAWGNSEYRKMSKTAVLCIEADFKSAFSHLGLVLLISIYSREGPSEDKVSAE